MKKKSHDGDLSRGGLIRSPSDIKSVLKPQLHFGDFT